MKSKKKLVAIATLLLVNLNAMAQEICGMVKDSKTKEPLIGATIEMEGGKLLGVTDID